LSKVIWQKAASRPVTPRGANALARRVRWAGTFARGGRRTVRNAFMCTTSSNDFDSYIYVGHFDIPLIVNNKRSLKTGVIYTNVVNCVSPLSTARFKAPPSTRVIDADRPCHVTLDSHCCRPLRRTPDRRRLTKPPSVTPPSAWSLFALCGGKLNLTCVCVSAH